MKPDPDDSRPIFVFASGWRSGSTLLQRLLCTHPDVMIWGENRGLVGHLAEGLGAVESLQKWSERHRTLHAERGANAWIALLNPPVSELMHGLRDLLLRYYAAPSLEEGATRWGFKEVRYDASVAEFLHQLFPEARFLFLVRHPSDCLASARGTTLGRRGLLVQSGGPQAFVDQWLRIVNSFHDAAADLPHHLLLYEDLVAHPAAATSALARFLDLDEHGFDQRVLDHVERGYEQPPRLDRADLRSLRTRRLWDTAARCGYEPRPELPSRSGWLERARRSMRDRAKD